MNHLEKLIDANEKLLEGLVEITELIRKNPFQMLTDANGTLRNAESMAKALQTATMTQRDLYGMKNIDQKFAWQKWRAEMKAKQAEAREMTGTVIRIESDEEEALDG